MTQRTEIRRGGHHRSLYQVNFVTLVVALSQGRLLELEVDGRDQAPGGTRLALVGASDGDVSVLVPTLVAALKTLTPVFSGLITYFAYSAFRTS